MCVCVYERGEEDEVCVGVHERGEGGEVCVGVYEGERGVKCVWVCMRGEGGEVCVCVCMRGGGCDSPKSLELVVESKFLPGCNLSYGEEANTKPPIHCPLHTQKHTHSEHGAA